ncbi:hypothetical protein ACIU1J_20345 [Azospirillum doebereinerae]|uniref:hypothetical protein n=1 Tax=Azospirillum doebereinerae TaxID=92933 RepID=UPI00384F5C75
MTAVRRGLALGALAVAAMALAIPGSAAAARGSVSFGIGVGPIFPSYGYYEPHRHYGPPPVVMYAPPPPPVVVYGQPPAVVYAPPPSVAADPTGPVYRSANGQQCREYQSTILIGGRPQPSFGTACLMADGTWRIVN